MVHTVRCKTSHTMVWRAYSTFWFGSGESKQEKKCDSKVRKLEFLGQIFPLLRWWPQRDCSISKFISAKTVSGFCFYAWSRHFHYSCILILCSSFCRGYSLACENLASAVKVNDRDTGFLFIPSASEGMSWVFFCSFPKIIWGKEVVWIHLRF